MKANREIRAPKVRVISQTGEQIGIISTQEALARAEEAGLDLVEIVPGSSPPVCKIMNYGKFRYEQTKREKGNKKTQHQIKVKEIKLKPNIDENDLNTKLRHARDFIHKGNKVKITCTFRGRETMHPEIGKKVVQKFCDELEEIAAPEAPMKMFGRILNVVLAPGSKKKKEAPKRPSSQEDAGSSEE
ncbi:translation initiation factor IF-3 [Parachlamydia sp. AcF125]|uniref:translation initiation factor IF-3 n=1 Tax=Parachlamydia sp. AcF125 TaxID=2795736 RepID=UPI001BCA08F3|nr:translation initiation factor IF-3 [Parachlamydia sp. AcF125]MBS4168563.1 Translation initiation factor IF-3 [Parachlamydia sp. AcF125]